jgi:hypothetical protein
VLWRDGRGIDNGIVSLNLVDRRTGASKELVMRFSGVLRIPADLVCQYDIRVATIIPRSGGVFIGRFHDSGRRYEVRVIAEPDR